LGLKLRKITRLILGNTPGEFQRWFQALALDFFCDSMPIREENKENTNYSTSRGKGKGRYSGLT
jgi:hypothetical protein